VLLALAIGVLLLSGLPLRWPRIAIPLGLFLAWSLLALAFSPDPAYGLAQERKIFVFLTLLTVYSTVRTLAEAKWLVYAWMLVGTGTAALRNGFAIWPKPAPPTPTSIISTLPTAFAALWATG
jgi:hypothetical protein